MKYVDTHWTSPVEGTVAMEESLRKIAEDYEEEFNKTFLPVRLTHCIHSVVFIPFCWQDNS